jgi:hypothetical protein
VSFDGTKIIYTNEKKRGGWLGFTQPRLRGTKNEYTIGYNNKKDGFAGLFIVIWGKMGIFLTKMIFW